MISITTTKTTRLYAAVAAAGLLLAGGATGAHAQQGQTQQRQYQQQQQQINVSDKQLKAFVEAENAAREIQQKYAGQQGEATSREDMQAQRQQLQDEMVQAIQSSGLSIDEYNQILQAIQTDQQLRQKYMDMAR